MKAVAEPRVKRELNHLQARLGQADTELKNATAAVYGQKKLLAATRRQKVETVDATAEWTDDKFGRRNRRCGRRSTKAAHCR